MNRLSYIIAALAGFFLLTMYSLYAAFLAGMMAILAPVPGLIYASWISRRLSARLNTPRRLIRNEEESASLEISGPSRWISSFHLLIEDREFTAVLHEDGLFSFPVRPPHCGIYETNQVRIWYTDFFSLRRFYLPSVSNRLVVMPRPLGNPEAILHVLSRLMAPVEMEYYGAAPYKAGDNPRLINWKVTARKDDVFVRESVPASSSELIIAVETSSDASVKDTVMDVLYSTGMALLSEHHVFTLFYLSSPNTPEKRIISNVSSFMTVLTHFLSHDGGNGVLMDASHLIPRGTPLLLITGYPDPAVPVHLKPAIWNAHNSGKGTIAGRQALERVLGGGRI
jgi:uncharacterized protein (DUF58 family)